jgi:hypothetical protein
VCLSARRLSRGAISKNRTQPVTAATPPVPAEPPLTFNQVRLLVAEGDRARARGTPAGRWTVSIVTAGRRDHISHNQRITAIFYARSSSPGA